MQNERTFGTCSKRCIQNGTISPLTSVLKRVVPQPIRAKMGRKVQEEKTRKAAAKSYQIDG